nr:hypothetical protein [Acetobacter papayae]
MGEDALQRYHALPHALEDMTGFHPEGYVMGEAGEAMIPLRVLGGFLVGLGDLRGMRRIAFPPYGGCVIWRCNRD